MLSRMASVVVLILLTLTVLLLPVATTATTNSNSILIGLKSSNVFNVLYGNQGWYVPYVYQGDNYYGVGPTLSWPVFYNGPQASQYYWFESGRDQPVLELVPPLGSSSGVVLWRETYVNGNVTVTMVGTYTTGSCCGPADGFYILMFVYPQDVIVGEPNFFASFVGNNNYAVPFFPSYSSGSFSPWQGVVILPQSDSKYLLVEWDPVWSAIWWYPHSGEWNVWVVSNPSGNLATANAWNGIGSGSFVPNPGDYVYISVTYDSQTNTLSGIAIDLNNSETASFVLNLNGYFNPPPSGTYYLFGVGGATGGGVANWGVLYINYSDRPYPWW